MCYLYYQRKTRVLQKYWPCGAVAGYLRQWGAAGAWVHFPVPWPLIANTFPAISGPPPPPKLRGDDTDSASGGGLKGIAYLNVSQGGRAHSSHSPRLVPLPLLNIPVGSSASLWDVPARTAAKENSWTTLFIYTAGRLKSLLFDWQELFIGLVPSELLGAGPSPANLPPPSRAWP